MSKYIKNLLVILGFTFFVLYVFLPEIVDSLIEIKWKDTFQKNQIQFQVEDLTPGQIVIRKICIAEAIKLESIEIDYGFNKGKGFRFQPVIKKLTLSGLRVHLNKDREQGFYIRGIQSKSNSPANFSFNKLKAFMGLLPQVISVENASIHLDTETKKLYFPCNLEINIKVDKNQLLCKGKTSISGNYLTFKGQMDYENGSGNGNLYCSLFPALQGISPVSFSGNLAVNGGSSEKLFENIIFQGETQAIEKWSFQQNQYKGQLKKPFCNISFRKTNKDFLGNFVLTASCWDTFSPEQVKLDDLEFSGQVKKEMSASPTIELKISAKDLSIKKSNFQGIIKSFEGRINGNINKQKLMAGTMGLNANKGKVFIDKDRFAMNNVKASIPFVLPLGRAPSFSPVLPAKGSFLINSITSSLLPKININLDSQIFQQQNHVLNVKGKVNCSQIKEPTIHFEGSLKNKHDPSLVLNIICPRFSLSSRKVKNLLPIKDLPLNFDLGISGGARVSWNKIKNIETKGNIEIHQGQIFNKDKTFEADGLKTNIQFDNLLALTSLPSQNIFFDTIKAGNFLFNKANISFTLEKQKSILMENIKVNWCKGLVSTEALRFPSDDKKGLVLTMYCDRLQLPMLLEQMGAFSAQGTGTVSGRIPVEFKKGLISFKKGFLFSTPGTGGRIILKNSNRLLGGIPFDSPQFSQLDLAREALKEFDYEWVTMQLNSEKETLKMNMEINGKPAHLLPFIYKKETGTFVRVDASSPGSHFQGIKLDVNLKLPFHQVLKFGNTMFNK